MAMIDDIEFDCIKPDQLVKLEKLLDDPTYTYVEVYYYKKINIFKEPGTEDFKLSCFECPYNNDDFIIYLLKKSKYIEYLTISGRLLSPRNLNNFIETIVQYTNIRHLYFNQIYKCGDNKIQLAEILGKLINNQQKPLLSLTINGHSTGYSCYGTTLDYIPFDFETLKNCIMSGSSLHTLCLNSISTCLAKSAYELTDNQDTQLKTVDIRCVELLKNIQTQHDDEEVEYNDEWEEIEASEAKNRKKEERRSQLAFTIQK